MPLNDPAIERATRVIEYPAFAPQRIAVSIAANLTGVGIQITRGPSSSDPLGQRGNFEHHFPDLESALAQLSGVCREAIAVIAQESSPVISARSRD